MQLTHHQPKTPLAFVGLSLLIAACAAKPVEYPSNYSGQEQRLIKSLSDDDIRQLKKGEGWGQAKAAELNGMPGPAHLLQMKRQIALTAEQESKIQALFDEMKAQAIPLGNRLIDLEAELNEAFANRSVTAESLGHQLRAIAEVRAALRYVHLITHVMTPGILTARQIDQYNRLRGYGAGDPCLNIPDGHDEAMWKSHNNCN